MYEGNGVTQDVVCNMEWNNDELGEDCYKYWNFKDYKACTNDEVRSMRIIYAEAGTTLSFYDSPDGSPSDDYTIIKIKRDISSGINVDTFEKSYEDDDIKVTHHHVNGLDGKISFFSVQMFMC